LLVAGIEYVSLVIDMAMPLEPIEVLHARGSAGHLRAIPDIARCDAASGRCEDERE
jgi:hypothetical protein